MVCFSKYPQDGQMMSLLPFGMFCRVFHGVTVAALSKFALGMGRYDTSDYHRLVKQKKAKADQVVTQLNLDKNNTYPSSAYTILSDSDASMLANQESTTNFFSSFLEDHKSI